MRLYKYEITNVPAESLHYVGEYDGEKIYDQRPDWRPAGWVEHVDAMADRGYRWAIRAASEDYPFFWPAEGKLYRSRSSAQDKVNIVKHWGGDARILEAHVSEFVPVEEANMRRKQDRALARIEKLRKEIDGIRHDAGLEVPF